MYVLMSQAIFHFFSYGIMYLSYLQFLPQTLQIPESRIPFRMDEGLDRTGSCCSHVWDHRDLSNRISHYIC